MGRPQPGVYHVRFVRLKEDYLRQRRNAVAVGTLWLNSASDQDRSIRTGDVVRPRLAVGRDPGRDILYGAISFPYGRVASSATSGNSSGSCCWMRTG